MSYPKKLADIITLMQGLPEIERREMLVAYADQAKKYEPREGEIFDLEDIRKDEECTDSVGVFLKVDEAGGCHFRIKLGPQVQTLTRAMTSILCKGLSGLTLEELQAVPQDFVPKIVGAELVRIRSHTVYYLLTRMKTAAAVWKKRQSRE
ncbi:MAG: SufE family protein [Verrucomicrobiae bacterium]|nr:SufE family protein [Verrucomicrobiae bacterium]